MRLTGRGARPRASLVVGAVLISLVAALAGAPASSPALADTIGDKIGNAEDDLVQANAAVSAAAEGARGRAHPAPGRAGGVQAGPGQALGRPPARGRRGRRRRAGHGRLDRGGGARPGGPGQHHRDQRPDRRPRPRRLHPGAVRRARGRALGHDAVGVRRPARGDPRGVALAEQGPLRPPGGQGRPRARQHPGASRRSRRSRSKRQEAATALKAAAEVAATARAAKAKIDALVAGRANALAVADNQRDKVKAQYAALKKEQQRLARLARERAAQGTGFTGTPDREPRVADPRRHDVRPGGLAGAPGLRLPLLPHGHRPQRRLRHRDPRGRRRQGRRTSRTPAPTACTP